MTTAAPTPQQSAFLSASGRLSLDDEPAPRAGLSVLEEEPARPYLSLPEPLAEASTSESAETAALRWAAAEEQGQRARMEDTHVAVIDVEAHYGRDYGAPPRSAFFGVFDGHSGIRAAEFARDKMLDLVVQQPSFPHHPLEALRSAYLSADERLFSDFTGSHASGCTALTALVWGRHLAVAHAGDSRAVLCRRGKTIELTHDHKPTLSSERERVYTAGGSVCGTSSSDSYLCGGLCHRKGTFMCSDAASGTAYENSHIGVTRALGDFHLSKLKYRSPDDNRWQGPLIAEPEVRMHELQPEDEFIILACDGLWDVIPSARAVEIVRTELKRHNSVARAAQSLTAQALAMHASDNVTVLVVGLGTAPPPVRSFRSQRDRPHLSRILSNHGLGSLATALEQAAE